MLSPILEQLVLEGKAEFKTMQTGGSAMATVPCLQGKMIVIVGFIWHGFTDEDINAEAADPTRAFEKAIHTMRLRTSSGKKRCYWTFRDSILFQRREELGKELVTFPPGQFYPCYFVSQDDVQVDVWKFNTGAFVGSFAGVNPAFNEPQSPQGYLGLSVAQQGFTSEGARISFLGVRNQQIAGASGTMRSEFYDEIQGTNVLADYDAFNGARTYAFPLVTFQYVQINEIPSNWLQ